MISMPQGEPSLRRGAPPVGGKAVITGISVAVGTSAVAVGGTYVPVGVGGTYVPVGVGGTYVPSL